MMKTDDYNDQSVTEEKLKDGAITTRKIADGSVTKDKLAPSIRQEINDSVTASNEVTEKAKEATAKADQATENAKQATAAATAAKEAADNATQLATNATTASAQATEQAKAATTKAEESAAKANEAAQRADDSREQTEQTLGTMQEVVDKVAIKDEEGTLVETPFRYIQNEEFIFAKVDAEDKLLFGIQWDGTPKFGKTSAVEDRLQSQVNLLAERVATIIGDEDTTNVIDTMNELKKFFAEIENTQTLTSILANLNSLNTKFGEDIKNLQDTKVDKEEGKSLIEDEVKECFNVIENEEYIIAVIDSNETVLCGILRANGEPYIPKKKLLDIEENEEYIFLIRDKNGNILFGIRREDGSFVPKEYNNSVTPILTDNDSDNIEETKDVNDKLLEYRDKYGYKNFKGIRVSDLLDLGFVAYDSLVERLNNQFPKKSELSESTNSLKNMINNIPIGGSGSNNNHDTKPNFAILKVTTIDTSDTIDKWPVDKKTPHNCKCIYKDQFSEIECYCTMKFQGNSTLLLPKKGFRIAFFEDESMSVKKYLKFGDLIETNQYNLKGFWTDKTLVKDTVINKLYKQAKMLRNFSERFPWAGNSDVYTGATGQVDGFPCAIYINNEFYGLNYLLLKKDAKNYGLLASSDGLLLSANGAQWYGEGITSGWDDEFDDNDPIKKEAFLNGLSSLMGNQEGMQQRVYEKSEIEKYFSIKDWIDYLIFVECFWLYDNIIKNTILYSDSTFTKCYPFLYDLDLSFGGGAFTSTSDAMNKSVIRDYMRSNYGYSFTDKIMDLYWDDFKSQFKQLYESGVLSYKNVENTILNIQANVPLSYYKKDFEKWDSQERQKQNNTSQLLKWYQERIEWVKSFFEYV